MPSRIDPGDYAPAASRSRRAFSNAPRYNPVETPKKRVHFGGVYEMATRQYNKPQQTPRPAPPVSSHSHERLPRLGHRAESSLIPHPSTFASPTRRPSLSRRTSSYRGGNTLYSTSRRAGDDGYRDKYPSTYDGRSYSKSYAAHPTTKQSSPSRGDSYFSSIKSASPSYSYSYSYSPSSTRHHDRRGFDEADYRRPRVMHYR